MNPLERIAEERIAEAVRRGAFEHLALAGQPLPADAAAAVPAELRAGYRVLKNAGCLPPEMELKRELVQLSDLLEATVGDEQRAELRRKLTAGRLRYELLMERRRPSAAHADYGAPVRARLGGDTQP